LAKEQWGGTVEALELVEKAILMQDDPPYSSLKARLMQREGDIQAGSAIASNALMRFPPVGAQDDFQLYWFGVAARIAAEDQLWKEADQESRKRAARPQAQAAVVGDFPDREQTMGEDD
jgi:hypothetical protein